MINTRYGFSMLVFFIVDKIQSLTSKEQKIQMPHIEETTLQTG